MKLDILKKLIKEAVREELEAILAEPAKQPIQETKQTFTKYNNYKPVKSTYVSTGDPMADLLEETRQGMVQGGPNTGYYPDMSQMVSAPGIGMQQQNLMEDSFARPEPGLDITQFDFLMKAGAIFKASNEKDKQRFGA